jgi:dinuclear metal center YbgI/SA1388 family protein
MPAPAVTVADVVAALSRHYPEALAESWDRVGLAAGSRSAPVTRILYAVDVTLDVVHEAKALGADLLVAHHPLLLRGVHAVDTDSPKGRVVAELVRSGISLYVAHTNADVPPCGVVDTLARALGLVDARPLRPGAGPELDKLVTFVPVEQAETLVDALADAGAGAIGDYDRCAFVGTGTGTFRPLDGAHPYLGRPGEIERVAEARVEMVLPRTARDAVVRALLTAHPYEEVAYDVLELAPTASRDTGLGRVGTLPEATTLGVFARRVAAVLPETGGGVRVSGDRGRPVSRVAVQAGAGDDLLEEARRSGADVYVTSDLRHHPASEARAFDSAPALVDVSHWAAESLWLPVAQRVVAAELAERGLAVDSAVSAVCTDPWNAHV